MSLDEFFATLWEPGIIEPGDIRRCRKDFFGGFSRSKEEVDLGYMIFLGIELKRPRRISSTQFIVLKMFSLDREEPYEQWYTIFNWISQGKKEELKKRDIML